MTIYYYSQSNDEALEFIIHVRGEDKVRQVVELLTGQSSCGGRS